MSEKPFSPVECLILAAIVACITLAAGALDLTDSMTKCQARGLSFDTCHSALYR